MKKYMYAKLLIALAIILTVTSCQKDWLTETNPNLISTDNFWRDTKDLQTGLTAVYKAFSSSQNHALIQELARTDLAWANGFQRPSNTNPYYLQIFTNAETPINNKWAANYTTIFRANQVILAAEKIIPTLTVAADIELANKILAQARFLRGFHYFNLYHSFNEGKLPIFEDVPVNEADFYKPLQTAETVKNFFLADLQYAVKNLPPTWTGKDKGRVTAGAAEALIGQTYLYENKFDVAAPYFKRVIENYGYKLMPNIGSNFTTMDELNDESILEISYATGYTDNYNNYDWRDVASTAGLQLQFTGVSGTYFGAVAANWLIKEYRNDPMDTQDERNYTIDKTTGNKRLRKFSQRTSWSVALVDDIDMPYYLRAETGQAANFNVNMTCFWRKHTNWDLTRGENILSPGKVRSGVNERLIRLGGIHLQYAECLIEMGQIDEALVQINKVRRRSGLQLLGLVGTGEFPTNDHDNVSYTAETLKKHLRYKEYPLELSAEGYGCERNVDLRRWGVKKQRFQELAARRYYAQHFVVKDEITGNNVTRWQSIVTEVTPTDPLANPAWNEFQEAAKNYNEAAHAYFPLPNGEILTNPRLYENIVN
ncbi:RagB/SusD family nutrient uptake outer membrane protein [Flavobacterium sp. NG2]|uniref:RagB/SusD family nutrient uptake outer membrane protein n=1 Tax=Flavobacterium sp. NG2 TaxID=3097547 RepID=UPI002A7EFBCE|nr:RagB/SusD family nutrient uptake outer membrane protein [Flavobacterium sp. NG2]WPR71085.1 RagB/SusD family nutrient uptake outer membrane protein [Flavobacterium sp. NG2]